jgi:hypothetical protein
MGTGTVSGPSKLHQFPLSTRRPGWSFERLFYPVIVRAQMAFIMRIEIVNIHSHLKDDDVL